MATTPPKKELHSSCFEYLHSELVNFFLAFDIKKGESQQLPSPTSPEPNLMASSAASNSSDNPEERPPSSVGQAKIERLGFLVGQKLIEK